MTPMGKPMAGALGGGANDPRVGLGEDLEAAAAAVREAEHELEARRAKLRSVIIEADELGLPVTRIAELTGLTRRSVYNALKRAGRR
jgi:DNA-directed RNA polymerase specialized sigma24 family protein